MGKAMRPALCAVVAAALLCGFSRAASALPDAGGFTVAEYDVRVVVSEDNAYSVTETIRVEFAEPRHGICREIPLDGGAVTDAGAFDVPYAVEESGGSVMIRMGDPDKTVTGSRIYRLHYTFLPAQYDLRYRDEAYFNLVGAGWDTTIDGVSFSVTLPKPFDGDKLGFSLGPDGSAGYDPGSLEFSVRGSTISGRVNRQLQPYEGLTVRLELQPGYFEGSGAGEALAAPRKDELPYEPEEVQEAPPDQPLARNFAFPGAMALVAAAGIAAVAVGAVAAAVVFKRGHSRPGVYDPAMQNMLEAERLRQQGFFNNDNHVTPPPPSPPPSPPQPPQSGSSGGGGSW